ncbi:hypothetical protein ULMA_05950 [Patiriisocius marinus]|uniref:Secretion system C-terminal sorting domain-containing protein n=2 Tax=Patiriisocius marinus TaxID=1397112 RepID=A0A5J4J1V8_9FLAO|nr:hypothetical protein ULMA_05950 [Patiriisocius marinus]
MLLFCAIFYSQAQIDNSAQQYNTLLNEYIDNNLKDYDLEKLTDREISGIKSSLRNTYKSQNNISIKNNTSKIVNGFNTFPLENSLIAAPILVGELFENSCGITFDYDTYSSSVTNGLTQQSLGSFTNSNNQYIPFNSGMILSTGFIENADGSNLNPIGNEFSDGGPASGAWDNYFDPFITEFGEFNSGYHNGTTIKFDITPETNHISFDYIFLSEEYNQYYECNIADVFVFILEDNEDSNVEPVNMAVLPGTNTPVQVTTVHPNIFQVNNANSPGNCNAVNAQFFSHYNWNPPFNPGPNPFNTVSPGLSPTIFDGQTIELTAEAMVIPNRSYTITLAIADYLDQSYDAAVLIENGSFNSDIDLNDDVTICNGQNTQLGISAISGASYQWALQNNAGNFNNISGATNNTYSTSVAGTYQLTVTINGCTYTDTVVVTTASTPVAQTPDDITVCDAAPNDGFALFDLTSVETAILNGQAGTITYYVSQADADNGVNEISNPGNYENSDQDQQTIYVRLNNAGCYDTVSFDIIVEICCEEAACPDIEINKNVVSPTIGIGNNVYEPGDTIIYSIMVTNNEPETTCPFTFDVSDHIDTTILDENTFNSNSFNVLYNVNTDIVSINNISLVSGASQTYYFNFEILDDTLAESIENCASVALNCIDTGNNMYESCVTTQIEQPVSIWPRTYGGDSFVNTGRYSEDVATDEEGNVYTLGNIAVGDRSYEDSNFVSGEQGYIMKHDYFGNLVWITPISSQFHHLKDGGLIKYYNNKLHVITSKGFYLQYNDDGTFINGSAYETRLEKPAISLNTNNGNIVIAGTYYSNFYNSDFSVNANSDRPTGVVIKFGATGIGANTLHDYITHQTFTHNGNSGKSSINFYDAVYAEDTDRIFLTGYSKGNRVFPNGQLANYTYGKSIIVTLKDNGNSLDMTHNAYIQYNTKYPYNEYRNSSDKIYITTATGRLCEIPFSESNISGFGQRTLIDNIFENDSYVKDMVINQETGDLFSIGVKSGYSEISKVSPQGRVWNKKVEHLQPKAIALGPLNHYFITGNYSDNTILNPGNPSNPSPIYEYGSPANYDNIFTARFKDYGNIGYFRNQEEDKTDFVNDVPNSFLIFPNPSAGNISVKKAKINETYNTVTISIKDFSGKVVFRKANVDASLVNTYRLEYLKTGLYFMEIINNGKSIEVHKIMINK